MRFVEPRMTERWRLLLIAAVAIGSIACGESRRVGSRPSSPNPRSDAGLDASAADGAPTADGAADGGGLDPDGASFDARPHADAHSGPDATPSDAGPEDGTPGADASPPSDAGLSQASQQIAQARSQLDGPTNVLIDGALVTYSRSTQHNELAGFAVQADPAGPALWVAVDPATLSPPPAPGDRVRLTVLEKGADPTGTGMHFASMVGGYQQIASGVSLGVLVQDLSNSADAVSGLDRYELELVRVSGTIGGGFRGAGTGFRAARIDTAGLSGDPSFELRMPATLEEQQALGVGCSFTVEAPLWRYTTRAQASAWTPADLRASSCPALHVVSASATRSDRVLVTFDRPLRKSSVSTTGSELAISGLSVAWARVTTSSILLGTSAQASGLSYFAQASTTITDARGIALDASSAGASFTGAPGVPRVLINEVGANITGGCDLIELRVLSSGSLDGFELRTRDLVIATLSGIFVSAGDHLVVHAFGGSAACNPSASSSEISSPTDYPASTYAGNFDTAYDVYGTGSGGIPATDTVLTLYDANRNVADAVFLASGVSGTTSRFTNDQAALVAAAGEWMTLTNEQPLGGFVGDTFRAHAVLDLDATGTDRIGTSIQRTSDSDSDNPSGWTDQSLATWGLPNPGQN